jgi:hypothetical protein
MVKSELSNDKEMFFKGIIIKGIFKILPYDYFILKRCFIFIITITISISVIRGKKERKKKITFSLEFNLFSAFFFFFNTKKKIIFVLINH